MIILLITLMLLTVGIVYSKDDTLKVKKIVIDVGHGGKDAGTSVDDILEKDLNLNVALKLKDKLKQHNVEVLMTRDGDYDLATPGASRRKKSDFDNRIKFINESGADLYLSIHMNFLGNSRYYGAQVFYTDTNKELAEVIQKEFISNLKSPMNEKKLDNSIYMYKQLNVPGVLIECGFLSNFKERKLLISDDYQEKIVDTIIKALFKYY